MASLREISNGMAAAVEVAGKSVVRVAGRRGPAASGVAWEKGLVLTADHVVEGDEADVTAEDGAQLHATVVGRDAGYDIAVLRAEGLTPEANFSNGPVRSGEFVLAIGRPRRVEATFGVVNAVAASRGWRGGSLGDLIHTDAPLNRGFSGGALVDADGAVVGFNSWYYGRGNTRSLPVSTLLRVAGNLRDHGRLRRAYLGLGTQPVYLSPDARTEAGQETGLMVVSLADGGPAATAGVLQGDTIIHLGGLAVTGMRDLVGTLALAEVGSPIEVRAIRAGKVVSVQVVAGERSEDAEG